MIALLIALALSTPSAPEPSLVPQVFAPGVLSGPESGSAPAFAPDGNTVYFTKSSPGSASKVAVSHWDRNEWSIPSIASFSGQWSDMEPTMAPDGSYIIFSSNRPSAPGLPPVDGVMAGKSQPGEGSHLWRVNRTEDGWSSPVELPADINSSGSTYAPSVSADGTIFFMRPNPQTNRFQLYTAKSDGKGGFELSKPLPFSDGSGTDVDPAVAPDQSFIVFGSGRHAKTDIDLFISFREGEGWGTPVYLGDDVNSKDSDAEARLSPDLSILYFASNRVVPVSPNPRSSEEVAMSAAAANARKNQYNIWYVDLQAAIRRARLEIQQDGRKLDS